MKYFLYLLLFLFIVSCAANDVEPIGEEEPSKEQSSEIIQISYQDALDAGYACYDASHYNDPIYPTDSVHIILPKTGEDVALELLSQAKVNGLSYIGNFGKHMKFDYYRSENYMTFCEDDSCFIFLPYEIPTKRGFTIIQDEPTKIIFKTDPSYTNLAPGYYITVQRHSTFLSLGTRKAPSLDVVITYEK